VRLPTFRWLLAVPVLAIGVAGYTLIDFLGSASHLRGRLPPPGDFGAAIDGEPEQVPDGALAAIERTSIATSIAPTGSLPPGDAAIGPAVFSASLQQRAMPPESESALVPGEVSPDVHSGIAPSPDDPTRDARRARTYELLEIARSSGDPDGSIRLALQDAVRDPDSETAYLARSALWQIQTSQDQLTGVPKE
jgi:hypothetical protein